MAEAAASPVRVFLVDDHPMARHGLAAMVAGAPALLRVGEAADGAQAVSTAPAARPDVFVIDHLMPGMDGIATMQALHLLLPEARFVLMLSEADPAVARSAVAAGASCLLLKTASTQDLVAAILAAHRGQRLDAPEVASALVANLQQASVGADLTRRERDLLLLLAQGLGNQDISTRLEIAVPTVKFHVTNILSKLQAENRTAAVLVALRHRLVSLDAAASAAST
jgi:NarL family two-component system response regulator LiaR